jgi:hypothetical protein
MRVETQPTSACNVNGMFNVASCREQRMMSKIRECYSSDL